MSKSNSNNMALQVKQNVKDIRRIYSDLSMIRSRIVTLQRIALAINQIRLDRNIGNLSSSTHGVTTTSAVTHNRVDTHKVINEQYSKLLSDFKNNSDKITQQSFNNLANKYNLKQLHKLTTLNMYTDLDKFIETKVDTKLSKLSSLKDWTQSNLSLKTLSSLTKWSITLAPLIFQIVDIALSAWQQQEEIRLQKLAQETMSKNVQAVRTQYGSNTAGARQQLRSIYG